MLQAISTIAWFAVAVASGPLEWSFWWVALAAFFAGSMHLANGPGYELVVTANREGRLSVFPRLLAVHVLIYVAIGAVIRLIAGAFA